MVDWVINNKEWIFSGIGISVPVALITVVRYLRQRKSQGSLSIESRFPVTVPQEGQVSAPIAIERISPVTPNELQVSIESATPLQKNAVAERYIGQRIEWDTELRSAEQEGSLVRLLLSAVKGTDSQYPYPVFVWCSVKLDEYPELAILLEKTHIRINGIITKVSSRTLSLDNARLTFPSLKNAA